MTRRNNSVYLRDILDAINHIEEYLAGVTLEAFQADRMRQDAVVRQIGIVGEASRKLSETFRRDHPGVPWSDAIGMRHKVLHDYFEVDCQTVWDTAREDLPDLRERVTSLLRASVGGTE